MTIDYDVVIIGGSLAGRYAALTATQLKAKVALVEPHANGALHSVNATPVATSRQSRRQSPQVGKPFQQSPGSGNPFLAARLHHGAGSTDSRLKSGNPPTALSSPTRWLPYGLIYYQALNEIGNLAKKLGEAEQFGLHTLCADTTEKCRVSVDAPQALLYAHTVVSNLQEQHSPAMLATKGVDVIVGSGQFQSSPHLAFAVNNRLLRSRTYLLATSVRVIPKIEGLQKTGFLTLSDIGQSLSNPTAPKNWVIIGGVPQSIELAQTLARLGYSVTLIVDRPYILSHVDPDIAYLLRSQLEAEGVRVLTQTPITQVRRIEDKKWLQAGDQAIETDEIVVAIGQQPNIESLNLAAVGVKWHQHRLLVNDKLQTTNHRIYACGDVIGGYDCPNIANYEARIALQNAVFFPKFKVNYQYVPWAIFTHPMLAQVGLTEAQAKRRYNQDEVIVLKQYFKTLIAAQLMNETTGICKLIVLRNGQILGASILGAEARELINIIALAIAQKIQVKHLANLFPIHPSFSEILEQTARDWSQQRLSSNVFLQDFLESFFHFRRNWNI